MKIIIADDHKIMREGLKSLLEKTAEVEVIAETGDGLTAVRLTRDLKPDLLILDITMPGLNGIEVAKKVTSTEPRVKVIGFSMHASNHLVVEMINAGASGYLFKDCDFEELLLAIKIVADGGQYFSTCDSFEKDVNPVDGHKNTVFSLLTTREREVLQLLVEGNSIRDIAEILYLSEKTVETHRSKVMLKLNVRNLAKLTKYAIREGLTPV